MQIYTEYLWTGCVNSSPIKSHVSKSKSPRTLMMMMLFQCVNEFWNYLCAKCYIPQKITRRIYFQLNFSGKSTQFSHNLKPLWCRITKQNIHIFIAIDIFLVQSFFLSLWSWIMIFFYSFSVRTIGFEGAFHITHTHTHITQSNREGGVLCIALNINNT